MKYLVTILLLALAAQYSHQADCDAKGSHDSVWGTRHPTDKVIYEKRVKLDYKILRKQSVDVYFPPKGSFNDYVISRIEAYDQQSDGTGGCAFISNGGVGQTAVTFHLKTQRGEGLDFLIKIYAQK
uniref:Venom protein family 3 protein 2 n=1 Tax=Lethocerus distinctifemur TaxID=280095 RepID=A0A2K8JU14_9HEMI|nr:venom protein family 3 protein 2 [Lethocerus distinctifemur]